MFARGDIVRLKEYDGAEIPIDPAYIGCRCIVIRSYWDEMRNQEMYRLCDLENRSGDYVERYGWAADELELEQERK